MPPQPPSHPTVLPPELPVLFDRDGLLAVDKPPGLPVHPTRDPQRPSVLAMVQRQNPTQHIGLIHRLDVDTSGVLLLARDKALEAELGRAFAERRVHKTYLALCEGQWTAELPFDIHNYLKPLKVRGIERMTAVRSGGEVARSQVVAVQNGRGVCAVVIQPQTGRRHQIRAHLSGLGLPLAGDALYGARGRPAAPRVLLHAWQVTLEHPQTGEALCIQSPLPRDLQEFAAGHGLDLAALSVPAQP